MADILKFFNDQQGVLKPLYMSYAQGERGKHPNNNLKKGRWSTFEDDPEAPSREGFSTFGDIHTEDGLQLLKEILLDVIRWNSSGIINGKLYRVKAKEDMGQDDDDYDAVPSHSTQRNYKHINPYEQIEIPKINYDPSVHSTDTPDWNWIKVKNYILNNYDADLGDMAKTVFKRMRDNGFTPGQIQKAINTFKKNRLDSTLYSMINPSTVDRFLQKIYNDTTLESDERLKEPVSMNERHMCDWTPDDPLEN